MTTYGSLLNHSLHKIMRERKDAYILGEDIIDPYGGAFKITNRLSTMYPNRVHSMPISEAGFTGMAIGMALRGLRPIIEIMFGDFVTLIADQVINGATKFSYMYNDQVSVPLVIRTPMGGYRGYGPTHSQALESLFVGVPHLRIVYPSLYSDPARLLEGEFNHDGVSLFIEGKTLYPQHVEQPSALAVLDHMGEPDIRIVTYGQIAQAAHDAALKAFMDREIFARVSVLEQIKPLDFNISAKRAIVVEEGVAGNVGNHIAAKLYEDNFDRLERPIRVVGANNHPIPNSKRQEQGALPSMNDILEAIYDVAS